MVDPNARTAPPGPPSPEAEASAAPVPGTKPPGDTPSSSGETVGPGPPEVSGYEIQGELGRGGMGVVYKARQVSLNRPVALKMVRDSALASPEQLARFRSEAEAVARLVHPNIVQIYDLCDRKDLPFYAMELVPGGSLAQKLDRKPMPPREAAELVESLARAIHYAHQQGIIHRDLKPANVLLTADGTAKISDFGLAKQLGSGSGVTPSTAVLGTPSYMAPEQAAGRLKEVGPATDVWALGAILYEALTGRPPFEAETMIQTLDQVRFQEPTAPTSVRNDVPPALEAICLRCLQKEPSRRYPSAAALAEDLQRFLTGKPLALIQTPDTIDRVTIPGYEVWEELARGGLWVVSRARDVRVKRLVALKRLRSGSPLTFEHLNRLHDTAEAALALDHPNIAKVLEMGGSGTGLYLAVELVEGGSLHQKVLGQPLLPNDAAHLVEILARAVQHAHEKGILHCHLHSANVLLDVTPEKEAPSPIEARLGVPKIIGFEMGRPLGEVSKQADALSTVRQVSYAMAPELLFNKPEQVGPATDVYALGVILYELLTGQPPYRAATTADLLLKVGFDILQQPRLVNRGVPRVLSDICIKALEQKPGERYPTPAALADDLRAFQEGKLTTPSLWQRLVGWFGRTFGTKQ